MFHSRTNDVANYRNSYGKNNTGTRDYQTNKVKTPEIPMGKTKKNGITPAIPMEKATKVLANFKFSNREN